MERVDAGSYGACELCDQPIEEEHLRVNPLVRICLSHLTQEQLRAIERDLDLAHRIQRTLLPVQQVRFDGWEVCYHYEPAGPVSGDYCDLVKPETEGGDAFFLFGDVSGKGVAASLLMSHLHAIFRSLIAAEVPLQQLVERANRVFCESTLSNHFAILVCAKARSTGAIEICNAGHCPPLLLRGEKTTPIGSTGLPVGMFYNGQYEISTLQLTKGDTLFLYTDGVTETRDGSQTEFGEERLSALIARHHALSPQALINTCLEDLTSFRAGAAKLDDITIMVIRRVE